ncbi:spore germination protein [Clostridium botulinum]|nr:spore germination protein [Clostridium botulinum]
MNINRDNELTEMQFTLILIGSMMGVGILSLPNDVIKISKQDGWISVLLGSVYPLYIVFIANYLGKNYPKENMLMLSKNFWKMLGTILNLIFILHFIIISTKVASDVSNVLHIYVVQFLDKWSMLIVMYCIIAYAIYGGTKTVGKLNEIIFFQPLLFFHTFSSYKGWKYHEFKTIFRKWSFEYNKRGKRNCFFLYSNRNDLINISFLKDSNKIKNVD